MSPQPTGCTRKLGSVATRAFCTCRMTTPTGRRMKEGNPVKRLLAGAIGTLGLASAVVACSSGGQTASPASSAAPSAATGTGAQVKVGGTDLAGLNPASVT